MTTDGSVEEPHPGLQTLRRTLHNVLESIATFGPSVAKPPIIDASIAISGDPSDETQHKDAVHGLRALRDAVRRDLENIEKFFADPRHASLPLPSTNARYLISVWNEVLLAPPPVTSIWSTFSESGAPTLPRRRGGKKEEGIKVDVVADGGKRWIRVNTIKNSKILAEFREIDSYMTDSEDGSDEDAEDNRPSLRQEEFDNSVLRMARPLLAAAKANPIPGSADTPTITLHLTRLETSPSNPKEYDDRISRTIKELENLGIEVRLGERDDIELEQLQRAKLDSPRRLQPTSRINLDLSILIALVSDLTHSPLPLSVEEADARFTPSASYVEWKMSRLAAQNIEIPEQPLELQNIAKPSRALATQALQEIVKALWEEMRERLSTSIEEGTVEFWTTPEAVDRCMQIVGKIGGPNEKRRVRAMFPEDEPHTIAQQEELFWQGSRFPRAYLPLFPIRLLPTASAQLLQESSEGEGSESSTFPPFFSALARTCRTILAQDVVPHPRASPSPAPGSARDTPTPEDDGEISRAAVTKANHRLTAHTVQTMLWGASRGWTTLTANKASVKAIVREMAAAGNAVWERAGVEESSVGAGEAEAAALWVVEPRSLAEGMRSDFGVV